MKSLFVFVVLVPSLAIAQEKRNLTIDEAVRIGLENSKMMDIAMERLNGAQARKAEATAQQLPTLKLGASYTRLSEVPDGKFTIPANAFGPGAPPVDVTSTVAPVVLNNYGVRATIQQPVFTGFRIENNKKIATLAEEASKRDLQNSESEFVYAVKVAYWNLFRAREVKKVVDENIGQVKAHLKDGENLLAQGMITNNDVLKLRVQLSNVELLGIDAKNAVELAMMNLNSLIGLPLETQTMTVSSLTMSAVDAMAVDAYVQQAFETRPDLRAMAIRVDAAGTGVDLARGLQYPQVFAVGNVYYNRPNQRYFPTKDEFKATWDVGVQVSFDAWNWGQTRQQIRQAMAASNEARLAKQLMEDQIRLEIAREYLASQQAREKIVVAEQTIRQAEESYRITSEKFKRGVALTTDLLDAEVAVLQAKTNHTQALVDFELAEARLKKAVGEAKK